MTLKQHLQITAPRQRAASKLCLAFVFAFALFTGLVPCQYSSRHAVLHATGLDQIVQEVHAQSGNDMYPDCDCRSDDYLAWNYCPYGNCRWTSWGCGWMWASPCIESTVNHPVPDPPAGGGSSGAGD